MKERETSLTSEGPIVWPTVSRPICATCRRYGKTISETTTDAASLGFFFTFL